jgi:dTDP-4-amino-4,6-dideoxygalactose transaminase
MFHLVSNFEQKVSEFFGSSYGVATDSCTHALELCLRYTGYNNITVPTQTYISVPMTLMKLELNWNWKNEEWDDYYHLGDTNIIDAAVLWGENTYIPNTFMCLSFQFKKHLSLGRGGMILLSDKNDYRELKKMSYDGRDLSRPWAEQDIDSIGYHYYMTPEVAKTGIQLLNERKKIPGKKWSHKDYPYLPNMSVFQK